MLKIYVMNPNKYFYNLFDNNNINVKFTYNFENLSEKIYFLC